MLNVNALKAEIVRHGLTQSKVAKKMNITPKTLSIKLKTGKLGLKEAEQLIKILKIQDPEAIFFCPESNLKSHKH